MRYVRLCILSKELVRHFIKKHYFKTVFFILTFLLLFTIVFLFRYPDIVETYYSKGVYLYIAMILRFLFGWIPFSFGDVFYSFLGIYFLRFLFRKKYPLRKRIKLFLVRLIIFSFVGYVSFYSLWGLNYYRIPLYKTLEIEHKYTTEQLEDFLEKIIQKANNLHYSIVNSDTLEVDIPYSKQQIIDKVTQGYKSLSEIFPALEYKPSSLKKSLYSSVLTYMGYSGYINPFTGEAHVNALVPKFHFPITASHEVAHQMGYSAENEANFIGYLAAVSHEDMYFKYSAYTFALRYALSEFRKRNPERYSLLYKKVHRGIIKGYKREYDFWKSYENSIEPVLKKTYNAYLKVNNQEAGIQSYSYVVALLVNYYQSHLL